MKNNTDFAQITLTYFNYIFFENKGNGDLLKKLTIQDNIDENDENCMKIFK